MAKLIISHMDVVSGDLAPEDGQSISYYNNAENARWGAVRACQRLFSDGMDSEEGKAVAAAGLALLDALKYNDSAYLAACALYTWHRHVVEVTEEEITDQEAVAWFESHPFVVDMDIYPYDECVAPNQRVILMENGEYVRLERHYAHVFIGRIGEQELYGGPWIQDDEPNADLPFDEPMAPGTVEEIMNRFAKESYDDRMKAAEITRIVK